MNDATKVTAGKPKVGGSVFRAPLGTTLPKSATESLVSEFENQGYISDAGVTNSNSPSNTAIKAWGGDTVLDVQTEKPDTWKFVMIETSRESVLKMVYGDGNVSGNLAEGIEIKANSDELQAQSLVIDMVLRGGGLKRVVLPNCKITAIADITYSDNAAVGYDVTLSCYPDDDGNTHYEYIIGEADPSL